MTQTIEQLTARVRELEEENARLKAAVEYAETIRVENIAYFEKQLATSQLREAQLRKALEAVIKVHGYESGIPVEAISTPASTEALDKYVAEKVKESHKVIPREGLVPHAYQLEATHNNAEYWYKWGHSKEAAEKGESVICMAQAVFAWRNAAYSKAKEVATLTRQRDLAVEALEKWDMFFGGDAETAVLTIAEDPSTLTGCQKATKEAMSAIKESDGK